MQEDKDKYEKKYNEKRLAMKELEKNTQSHITQLERDRAIIEEKLQSSERKYNDEVRNKEKEILELKERLATDSMKMSGNASILEEEITTQKMRIAELERREADLSSQYDKDQALWDGKYKFLEERNEQLKQEIVLKNQKIEETIMQL